MESSNLPVKHEDSTSVGWMNPRTLAEVKEVAELIKKSGLAPKGVDTPEKICIALQMGAEVGLKPMAALQNTAVINGRPSLYGDVALAVAMASPVFDASQFIESIDEIDGELVATCRCCRVGGNVVERTFSMKDARAAQLENKPGPWKQYPRRMLQMRARSWALRDAFPDVLQGMPIAEEVRDIIDVDARSTLEGEEKAAQILNEMSEPKPVEKKTAKKRTTRKKKEAAKTKEKEPTEEKSTPGGDAFPFGHNAEESKVEASTQIESEPVEEESSEEVKKKVAADDAVIACWQKYKEIAKSQGYEDAKHVGAKYKQRCQDFGRLPKEMTIDLLEVVESWAKHDFKF